MKKYLLVGVAVVLLGAWKVWADGSSRPVLDLGNGTSYLYPNGASPQGGGVMVNNGVNQFQWSNGVVVTTTAATVFQMPALPLLTLNQINALTPATTGQLTFCTNCVASPVCVSSSVFAAGWVALSTGVAPISHCF